MLSFSGSLKVFVAVETCDMHRSFNGVHDAVGTIHGWMQDQANAGAPP